jgi:nucleoside-diphosphate-sugar epimerase
MSDPQPKTLAVFGASGGVGHHVVADALAAGYDARAFVRDASKLEVSDGHRLWSANSPKPIGLPRRWSAPRR